MADPLLQADAYRAMLAEQQQFGNRDILGAPTSAQMITTARLKRQTDEALAEHWSLDPRQRVLHSRDMAQRVAEHFPAKSGHGAMLTTTAKMDKTAMTPEEAAHPLLAGKSGFLTTGLAFSPAYRIGNFNFCNNSVGCWRECLEVKSGQYGAASEGGKVDVFKGNARIAGLRRSHAFINDPGAFAVRLDDAIQSKKQAAAEQGKLLGVRLNILSDIHPDVWRSLYARHPDAMFYDYTKNATRPLGIANHHITHSLRGASHPVGYNGVEDVPIDSPFQNWKQMRQRLLQGENVAMPFAVRAPHELPKLVHDEESGLMIPVIDGDRHDLRPLDPRQASGMGVIVGLRDKISQGQVRNHARETHGFITPYDPQNKLDGKGRVVLAASPKLSRSGRPARIPVPTNEVVTIAPQGAKRTVTRHADGSIAPPEEQQ